MFFKKKLRLSYEEYSDLIQEVTIVAFHDIFTSKMVNKSISLDDSNRNIFAIEYVCASLFLMVDIFTDSFIEKDILYGLLDDVTNKIFCRILNNNASDENLAKYKSYYLDRSERYNDFYDRSSESMLTMAQHLVRYIHAPDAISNFESDKFVLDMILATLMSYRNIINKTTVIKNKDGYLFEVNK